MVLACSHTVIATDRVTHMKSFFEECFQIKPYFENSEFCEFVLPSAFRVAFFKPVGSASKYFKSSSTRETHSLGLTVKNVETFYESIKDQLASWGASVSGPPKDHPWGEKSFLLIDPDGNRWEIVQSPTPDGKLVNL